MELGERAQEILSITEDTVENVSDTVAKINEARTLEEQCQSTVKGSVERVRNELSDHYKASINLTAQTLLPQSSEKLAILNSVGAELRRTLEGIQINGNAANAITSLEAELLKCRDGVLKEAGDISKAIDATASKVGVELSLMKSILVESIEETIPGVLENAVESVEEALSEVENAVEDAVADACETIEDMVVDEIEAVVTELFDAITEEVANEISEIITNSAITSALAPTLASVQPQLTTVNQVAPTINQLLRLN